MRILTYYPVLALGTAIQSCASSILDIHTILLPLTSPCHYPIFGNVNTSESVYHYRSARNIVVIQSDGAQPVSCTEGNHDQASKGPAEQETQEMHSTESKEKHTSNNTSTAGNQQPAPLAESPCPEGQDTLFCEDCGGSESSTEWVNG